MSFHVRLMRVVQMPLEEHDNLTTGHLVVENLLE